MTKRIGFLFNHEAIHQVSHLAPMIPAFARRALDAHIDIIASSFEQLKVIQSIIGHVPGCKYHLLDMPASSGHLNQILSKAGPWKRYATLKHNLDLFRSLDALIVPERTSLLLKTHFGLTDLKLIRVCHGAGDRDVAWSQNISQFDYVLLPGKKHRDRMLELGIITPENHAVIGYMKFDAFAEAEQNTPSLHKVRKIFSNDKPVVVYNPHFDPYLSSWYTMGNEVLSYFAENQDYNLIFAPHIMLFKRRLHTSLANKTVRWRKNLSKRFENIDNIHIDPGSLASVDMTYLNAADIYLGDVSSQVYEFIAKPRPCIFLNGHNALWENNPQYRFWQLGPVAENVSALDKALANADKDFSIYAGKQRDWFAKSIYMPPTPAADVAADAVIKFMDIEPCPQVAIEK